MEEKLNLHQRLLKIANIAGALQRTKEGYGYRYVPEEDIQAKVTAGMQKYGVMLYEQIVPGSLKMESRDYIRVNSKGKETPVHEVVVSADAIYTWVNVDNPTEQFSVPWVIIGQMEDASQAFGAATTYCNRYFLMKSLQLATTEADPDYYRSKQMDAEDIEAKLEEEKAAKEASAAVEKLIAKGNALLEKGVDRKELTATIAGVNNGNGNPMSIKSKEVAEAAIKALDKLITAKKPVSKTTTKTDKGEEK